MNESEEAVRKKKKKKRLGHFLFILLNVAVIGVTAYIEFGTNKTVSPKDMLDVNMRYLLLVLGCFLVCIASETAKYVLIIRHSTGVTSLREGFMVAIIGKYYDFITPLSAGGQPFQAIYLVRRGVETGTATAIPIAGFLTRHAAFISVALVVLIFGGSVTGNSTLLIPAIFGLVCVTLVPLAILFFGLAPSVTEKIIHWIVCFLFKMKLLKDPDGREEIIIKDLHSYIGSMATIFNGKSMFLKVFLLSLAFELGMDSMPYFVLRAFGNSLTFISVFRSCVFIYLCISFIPTPGNSGAAEGSFYALFSVLGQGNIFWAMLIWRLFSYYSFLLVGLFTISRTTRKNINPENDLGTPESGSGTPENDPGT
jgi:uncharacterized protein (TIRG00374 family)